MESIILFVNAILFIFDVFAGSHYMHMYINKNPNRRYKFIDLGFATMFYFMALKVYVWR